MKDLRVYWTVRELVLPVALIVSVLLASSGPAGAADQSKKKASVQIGFLGGVTTPQNFQSVLLNVQAVRINPNSSAGPGGHRLSHRDPPVAECISDPDERFRAPFLR